MQEFSADYVTLQLGNIQPYKWKSGLHVYAILSYRPLGAVASVSTVFTPVLHLTCTILRKCMEIQHQALAKCETRVREYYYRCIKHRRQQIPE